jgi:hypothetical protein
MNHNGNPIEARLWDAADELRTNSKLKSSDMPIRLAQVTPTGSGAALSPPTSAIGHVAAGELG